MIYLNTLKKYIAFQVVWVLIWVSHVFGGPVHISGSVHGYSQSTVPHISGAVYLGGSSPTVKTHISGSKKEMPFINPEPVQSQAVRKTKNIGIILGSPEKTTSTQVRKKILGKLK